MKNPNWENLATQRRPRGECPARNIQIRNPNEENLATRRRASPQFGPVQSIFFLFFFFYLNFQSSSTTLEIEVRKSGRDYRERERERENQRNKVRRSREKDARRWVRVKRIINDRVDHWWDIRNLSLSLSHSLNNSIGVKGHAREISGTDIRGNANLLWFYFQWQMGDFQIGGCQSSPNPR